MLRSVCCRCIMVMLVVGCTILTGCARSDVSLPGDYEFDKDLTYEAIINAMDMKGDAMDDMVKSLMAVLVDDMDYFVQLEAEGVFRLRSIHDGNYDWYIGTWTRNSKAITISVTESDDGPDTVTATFERGVLTFPMFGTNGEVILVFRKKPATV